MTRYIGIIVILLFLYSSLAQDEGSGSGSDEEDPMKIARQENVEKVAQKMKAMHKAKTNEDLSASLKTDDESTLTRRVTKRFDHSYLPAVHHLWNYWHTKGGNNDIDSENLMAQTGGAKQVMHSIASKLVSHTSNKITNHVGNIITSSLVNKKSSVSAGKNDNNGNKALSSTSEVVLPISSVAKLTNTSQDKDSLGSEKEKNETADITTPVNKPSTEVKAFVDAPPIAPMESIKVEVKGKSTAYSNFTHMPIEGEEVRDSKVDVLKFEDGLISNSNEGLKKTNIDSTKTLKNEKAQSIKKSNQKKSSKKQKKKTSKKSKKSSKRSKISAFPKIILYQGPISKALESMLSVHSTPRLKEQSSFINSPMSFEEATADIKRSHIPKSPDKTDDSINENVESSSTDEVARSKVAKSPKKYTVKGYPDSAVTGERKTMKAKKSKNVKGKKKFSFSKRRNAQLKDGEKNGNAGKEEDNPFGFPSFMKAFPIFASGNPLNPIVPTGKQKNEDKEPEKKPNSQLFDPLKERPYKPSPPNDNQITKETENKTNLITFQPIPLNNNNDDTPEKEEEESVPPSDKDDDKVPTPPPLLEIGDEKPAGVVEEGKTQLADEENEDEDDDDDIQVNNNKNSTTGPLTPSIVTEPLQNNPLPTPISNSGTPNPVVNSPDNQDMEKQQTNINLANVLPKLGQTNKPITNKPNLNIGQPQTSNQPKLSPIDLGLGVKPTLNVDKPQTIQQPNLVAIEPGNGNILPMDPNGGMSEEEGREMLDQVDSNAQTIDTLSGEMRALETRLTELESAVNDVTDDVRKLEKKIDKPQKPSANSFTEFVGPIENLKGDFKPSKLPKIFSVFKNLRPKKPSKQFRRPKILKEFFVPLPPANSPAAKAIQNGAPINGLPFPLNIIVSKIFKKMENVGPSEQMSNQSPITIQGPFPFRLPSKMPFQSKPWRQPQPLPEVSFPPTEHDIDQLELEMGKTPITRYPNKEKKKPKIIIFSKSPRIFDLTEKPCEEPCLNGGTCIAGNVCKCPFSFIGPKCEKPLQRSPVPEDILDILGGEQDSDSEAEEEPKKSNLVSLPLMVSNMKPEKNDDDADDEQKTVGLVEQNKIVNMLRQIGKSFPFLPELSKRSDIPNSYLNNEYPIRNKYEQDIVPRSEIYERYRIPGERRFLNTPENFHYSRSHDYYRKKH